MPRSVDLVVLDLRENNLLFHAELKLPRPSKDLAEMPRKSRMRGIATVTKRSKNSYMRALRKVTLQPIG